MKKKLLTIMLACALSLGCAAPAMAEENVTTMENSGAYLFTWRPIDCGNGRSFAILVGGNTIHDYSGKIAHALKRVQRMRAAV